jgi:hypothetical protein
MVTTILIVALTLSLTFILLFSSAKAAYVEITSVSPKTHRGNVGEMVHIIGTINTTDGLCRVWFDTSIVNETRAVGNGVDATFLVPLLPRGNYTITLHDDETKNNATTWFYVETAYYIAPELPEGRKQLQQGDSVNLHLNVTGGKRNTVYYANVTVAAPNSLNISYSAMVELANTTSIGYGNATVRYPDGLLFHSSGSHTNYTGLYYVYFNKTEDLAGNSFFIGLTNASDYHRGEMMEIRAVGYQPNETANITVTFLETNKAFPSIVVNASQQGTINAVWLVPLKASIGSYNVTLTSEVTIKDVRDSQLFSVPGYRIDVYTRNLAGDILTEMTVEALDKATNSRYNITSDTDGLAQLWLEKGDHTLEAFWKEVKVNETQITVDGEDTYNLTCELTNVKIVVEDKNEIRIPFVHLNISYQYVTTKDSKVKNESITGETNLSGVFDLNSTLPHITYTIDAFRYEESFNKNNNTIEDLPAEKCCNVSILCPAKTLTLNITDHHQNSLPNARVEMIEKMGGIQYNTIAKDTGIAVINCTFGRYEVKVYLNDLFLTEAFVDLFNDTYAEIYCQLANLAVSVKTVDYFGQPIPIVDVTLQRNGLQYSPSAKSNGIIEFTEITGGDLQIIVHLQGQSQSCVTKTCFVDEPTTIEIKIEKYVMLAGFLVETSKLATALVIAAAILLILSIEIYRRKRLKSQKNSS